MAAIRALLNPAISVNEDREPKVGRKLPPRLLSPIKSTGLPDIRSSPGSRKKQKIVKDRPVFTRGPPRGEVRYPPFEYDNPSLSAYHQQFDMFPMEDIGAYPRHIPYNSEKKLFQEKTGRDFFEVYQYQFKMPGSEHSYTLLWDYNIGLTTPAKMLNRNVGLREICHSITGGSLVAQGYWIPYDAARAVAATFCWDIRYVLTPVFGIEFLDMCIPPDSDKYGLMLIDPKITKLCTEQACEYRQLELVNPPPRPRCALPSPPLSNTHMDMKVIPYLRFKAINDDISSEHATETSDDDHYTLSPSSPVPFRHPWYTGNTPRSARHHDDDLISPKSVIDTIKPKAVTERGHDIEIESSAATTASSSKFHGLCDRIAVDEGYDGDSSDIVIELHGLEFEIANAAFQAGFHTANHEALFNLIWALKRAGNRCFGSSGESRLPPPKHPIYPDRYRPSGIGDNTMKKRKLTAGSQPKIHSIPLVQKGNTKDDPIDLDDDPSPRALAIVRGLTSTSMINDSQDQALDIDEFAKEYAPWNTVSSANQSTKKTGSNNLELGRPNRLLENMTQGYSLPMRPADRHISLQQARDIPTMLHSRTKTVDVPMSGEEEIVEALCHVKLRLIQTKNAISSCQEDMRKLFDRHPDQLCDDQKMFVLRSLAKDMDNVWEAAKAGVSNTEMMLALMEGNNSGNTLIDV
ncbi:hypothetical protein DV736_g3605, partial [Chaetothyriales sp. CBS 134916]